MNIQTAFDQLEDFRSTNGFTSHIDYATDLTRNGQSILIGWEQLKGVLVLSPDGTVKLLDGLATVAVELMPGVYSAFAARMAAGLPAVV